MQIIIEYVVFVIKECYYLFSPAVWLTHTWWIWVIWLLMANLPSLNSISCYLLVPNPPIVSLSHIIIFECFDFTVLCNYVAGEAFANLVTFTTIMLLDTNLLINLVV